MQKLGPKLSKGVDFALFTKTVASHVIDKPCQYTSENGFVFETCFLLRRVVRSLFSNLLSVELSSDAMTFNDHPPPVDLSDLGNADGGPETDWDDSDEDSSGSESGFEFDSDEDEVSEEIVAHYIAEQDHDDIVQENLELTRQNEALDVVKEAVRAEKNEAIQALKRKMEEREEFDRFKRLRVAIREAYRFMGIAAPLIEGDASGSVTGSGQAPLEEKAVAVTNFQMATAEARRCLEELHLYRDQMDED